MHNRDDKYLARPGFEPGISSLQAPVDTNEPSEHYRAWDEDCNMTTRHLISCDKYQIPANISVSISMICSIINIYAMF